MVGEHQRCPRVAQRMRARAEGAKPIRESNCRLSPLDSRSDAICRSPVVSRRRLVQPCLDYEKLIERRVALVKAVRPSQRPGVLISKPTARLRAMGLPLGSGQLPQRRHVQHSVRDDPLQLQVLRVALAQLRRVVAFILRHLFRQV